MEERRSHIRQLTCIPANLGKAQEADQVALIRDASISGARLFARSEMAIDEPVTLNLYITDDPKVSRPVRGRVVRVERRAREVADVWSWDVGVEFDEPITDYADEIEALCERQRDSGLLKED